MDSWFSENPKSHGFESVSDPLKRFFGKAPVGCQSIGRFFTIRDFAPASIVQIRVGKLMGDDVTSKCVRTPFQPGFEDNTSTATVGSKLRHHDGSTASRLAIIQRNPEIGIRQKVTLDLGWQIGQNPLHTLRYQRELGKGLKVD